MADRTRIEWADATWNPVSGCTRVSPGCVNCYIDWAPPFRINGRHFRDALGNRSHAIGSTTGVLLHPDRLDQPMRWRRPRRIFVNSLSDLFHEAVPDQYIAQVFAVMAMSPRHTFQVLTKRHGRMKALLNSESFWKMVRFSVTEDLRRVDEAVGLVQNPLPNVWLGVTVEDQKYAEMRIAALLATPAAVRFLSCEPLLGPINLTHLDVERHSDDMYWINALTGRNTDMGRPCADVNKVDWVIVGGESGPDARPVHPDWVRSLRDQCTRARTPFLFKQWGEWIEPEVPQVGDRWLLPDRPGSNGMDGMQDWKPGNVGADAGRWAQFPDVVLRRVGKRNAGRTLDGVEWTQYPASVS